MKHQIELWSAFDGENTGCKGEIEVGGVLRTFAASGSASARGTEAKVDGVEEWWCGQGVEGSVEQAVNHVFELAWNHAENNGGTEGSWKAKVVNGEVVSFDREEDEDEDEE